MSRTTIYTFDLNGDLCTAGEIGNSFRSGMAIWGYLYHKHFGHTQKAQMCAVFGSKDTPPLFDVEEMDKLWQLAGRDDIPADERIALATTLDMVIVRPEDIERVASALEQVSMQISAPNSFFEQAQVLREVDTSRCLGVCWSQTSVADAWLDREEPYNVLKNDEHWWLFDRVKL